MHKIIARTIIDMKLLIVMRGNSVSGLFIIK